MDETLTAELPAIRRLVARLEETVRQAQGQLPRKGLGETTAAYLAYLRDRYQYLAFPSRIAAGRDLGAEAVATGRA